MFLLFLLCCVGNAYAASEFACGPGYVLAEHKKIDGLSAAECQKLWCVDLETGKAMGRGNTPNSGYKSTAYPVEMAVGSQKVTCWGERKWCAGQEVGEWDSRHGLYVRGTYNADSAYESFQKGGCFSWQLEAHNCPVGTTAFLKDDGSWECLEQKKTVEQFRGSVIRRSGVPRRLIKQ